MNRITETPISTDGSHPILVAIDFSDDSRAALVWASDYAALVSAPIIVLHVIHDPAENPGFYNKAGHSALLPLEDVAQEKMDEFMKEVASDYSDLESPFPIEKKFAVGLPAGRITAVAEKEGAQMIVIGTRGRTGLSNLLLGSVAKQVLKKSGVPVVVVKGDQQKPPE